jgi:phage tail-like protein
VNFFALVQVREPLSAFTLRITLPEGLAPGITHAPGNVVPQVALDEGVSHLVWNIRGRIRAGTQYEFQVEARVIPTHEDQALKGRAAVSAIGERSTPSPDAQETSFSDEESVTIAVSAKGHYLNYLPALYHKDELMGRFLMLFESFWKPVKSQIEHVPYYFDPKFTPPDFLPWLASWLDLVLDEHWPEGRRRLLIRSAAALYRERGTKRGLQRYLEIFLGDKVEIVEHRANNFRLGAEGRLGPGIALGTINVPHTFTVILPSPSVPPLADEAGRAREEMERRRIMEAIIQTEKPAHTGYSLRYEPS